MLSIEIGYKILVQWYCYFVELSLGIVKGVKRVYEGFRHEDFHQ